MGIFNIFRTERPVSENKSELIGQTADLNKAQNIMRKANKDPLKKESKDGLAVKGINTVTEIFTKDELKNVGYSGGDIPLQLKLKLEIRVQLNLVERGLWVPEVGRNVSRGFEKTVEVIQ